MTSHTEQAASPPQMDMAQLLAEAEPIRNLRRGEVVMGEVMRVDAEGILVNVGHKTEGVIPPREMRSLSPEEQDAIQPGDEVFAYVIRTASDEEPALLSLDKAKGERGWAVLQQYLDSTDLVEGVIQGFNRGGAVVEVEGLQGFIPLSQLAPISRSSSDTDQEEILAQRVGESVQLRLLELDRRRNRVILSERQVLQKQRELGKDRRREGLDLAHRAEIRAGAGTAERTSHDAYYYAEPIKAKAACMYCHGEPKGKPDPYFPQYKKDGWRDGEIIGAVISRVAAYGGTDR